MAQLDTVTDPFSDAFDHALDTCLSFFVRLKSQVGLPAVSFYVLIFLLYPCFPVF